MRVPKLCEFTEIYPWAVRNQEFASVTSSDCCNISRNLISDDLPALFRPIKTVMGRSRTWIGSLNVRKLLSSMSVSIAGIPLVLLDVNDFQAFNAAIIDDLYGYPAVFAEHKWQSRFPDMLRSAFVDFCS